ncbi:hypothetical protein [Jeotgalibacillus campisalis]|uniref:Uncharacterized protein n=1 Tax=Jeotgalibacillus campisalis TaxID=220754 RepID=A0A0C2VB69_9BACL|nr:hypothetical protein [Jeotgalibacillus campisalis]KIL46182.1 hypothetical protein KR50_28570 [Jeotgalibacillus campisalis]
MPISVANTTGQAIAQEGFKWVYTKEYEAINPHRVAGMNAPDKYEVPIALVYRGYVKQVKED